MTTQTASSYCPINALTRLLPSSSNINGFSYTCLANFRTSGSEGGNANSLGPYRARREESEEVDRPWVGCVESADNVSYLSVKEEGERAHVYGFMGEDCAWSLPRSPFG